MNVTYIQLHGINHQINKTFNLIFNGKDLTTLPGQINRLTLLNSLTINSRFFERTDLSLPNLTSLIINAPLTNFPDLSKLPKLKTLTITNAKFDSVSLTNANLEYVTIKNSNIETISIGYLKKLVVLDLTGNKIKVIPDSFKKLRGLNELILDSNPIEYLADLRNLKWLKNLSLHRVNIDSIEWLQNIEEA